MRPHEKLEVYQLAHHLAVDVHRLSLMLPRLENYEQASQVRRSSKSVSAQIVEGHALRNYRNDYVRFLCRAYASAEETVEHIRLLIETGSAVQYLADWNRLLTEFDTLCRRLYNYISVVSQRHADQRITKRTRRQEIQPDDPVTG